MMNNVVMVVVVIIVMADCNSCENMCQSSEQRKRGYPYLCSGSHDDSDRQRGQDMAKALNESLFVFCLSVFRMPESAHLLL